MPLYRPQTFSHEGLLAIAANLLDKAFFDTSRALAKRRYQALEQGDRVFLVNVAMADGSEVPVDLRLDRSELRGSFNFSAFRDLVGRLLVAISRQLDASQMPPVFSSADNQRLSFLIPIVHRGSECDDVLIPGFDLRCPGAMTLELLFVDPLQFQSQVADAG